MNIFVLLPVIISMIGLYFITIGLWELREGVDRKKYVTYMFTGLVLLLIVATLFPSVLMMFFS
ncbi:MULTISPECIES: hypothetical protein [unclassified Fredinandcohnia]|uniref:hypothetical protein n=1 Tax=unclassified Fredinandcohnia TaxID=2837514 RepID=UPI0030FDD2CC